MEKEVCCDYHDKQYGQGQYSDRAALHKEILAKLPTPCDGYPLPEENYEKTKGETARVAWNNCLIEVRKAIDEVFNSKK